MVKEKTYLVIGLFSEIEAKNVKKFLNSAGMNQSFLGEKAVLKYILSNHKTGLQDGVCRSRCQDKKSVRIKFYLPEETYLILHTFCHPDSTQKKRYSISKIVAQSVLHYLDTYNSQNN